MTLESRQGDLFASDVDALAHGCNCAGAMGRGIAVEFRRRWPEMYEEYKARCGSDRFGLGDVFVWEADGQTIYNLGTQKTWRTKAQLTAIESSVRSMLEHAESAGIRSVGIPRIGAGLGGDWRGRTSKNASTVSLIARRCGWSSTNWGIEGTEMRCQRGILECPR